jgi:hypothetical protein
MLIVPEDVVDGDDVLFVSVFRVADDGGARLQPEEAAVLVHQAVIIGEHLAFGHNCHDQNAKSISFSEIKLAKRGGCITAAGWAAPLDD